MILDITIKSLKQYNTYYKREKLKYQNIGFVHKIVLKKVILLLCYKQKKKLYQMLHYVMNKDYKITTEKQ